MKTVFITGATGFIGKNVLERLMREDNYKILCLAAENDKEGISFLEKNHIAYIYQKDFDSFNENIDFCIHLASYGVAYGARDLDWMIDVNIKLAEQILRFCSKHNCEMFINTGSCFEYGMKNSDHLIIESDILAPDDIYAATKVACETVLKVYSRLLGIKFITVRPFSVFGKYEVQSRLGPLLIKSGEEGKSIELTGCEQVRYYIDVRDLADALIRLIINNQNTVDGEAINLCSGNAISLRKFVLLVFEAFGYDKNLLLFGKKEYRKNESMYFAGSNFRLMQIIGDQDYSISLNKIRDSFGE